MTLKIAVERAIEKSGLKPIEWAKSRAKIPKSTFLDIVKTGTASGRNLAKLQAAGVVVADRRVIASLAPAA